MNKSEKIIAVFGGTGNIGRYIVKKLVEKGQNVKVLSRNKKNAIEILGDAVKIVEGDITNEESVTEMLKGAESVLICVSAFSWKTIKRTREIERDGVLTVINETERAGISRLVYTSGYDLREDVLRKLDALPFGRIKMEIESTIKKSRLNWTILGFAPSTNIFFAFLRKNKLMVPGGGRARIPTVSIFDVAEITAQTLFRNDLGRKRFRVTGPEAISFPEAAERMSEISGRKITCQKIPLVLIKTAAFLTRPFNPFFQHVIWSLKLLNNFPADISDRVPDDHKILTETFDYSSTSLDAEIKEHFS